MAGWWTRLRGVLGRPPSGLLGLGDALEDQFRALEYHGNEEQQLLELKQKMGVLAPGSGEAKQLEAGDGDVEDAEVVEEDDSPA